MVGPSVHLSEAATRCSKIGRVVRLVWCQAQVIDDEPILFIDRVPGQTYHDKADFIAQHEAYGVELGQSGVVAKNGSLKVSAVKVQRVENRQRHLTIEQ